MEKTADVDPRVQTYTVQVPEIDPEVRALLAELFRRRSRERQVLERRRAQQPAPDSVASEDLLDIWEQRNQQR